MITALKRTLPFLFAFAAVSGAFAEGWTSPTPEELQMTAEAAAPGAAAIYLLRDERADDKLHIHSLYVRLKVLTEKGKEYADVEIPYEGRSFNIRDVQGRTIHSDGAVIPFTGKPYEKLIEKTKTQQYKAKIFTLPDVQVGSIIEYRYELGYHDNLVDSPQWYIQQPLYLRKAHYEFLPTEHLLEDGHGGVVNGSVVYSAMLPPKVAVQYVPSQKVYALDIEKVDPELDEEFMPPMKSISYPGTLLLHSRQNGGRILEDRGQILDEGHRQVHECWQAGTGCESDRRSL